MQLVVLKKVLAVSVLQSCVCYLLSSNACVCVCASVCVCVCVSHTGHADSGTKKILALSPPNVSSVTYSVTTGVCVYATQGIQTVVMKEVLPVTLLQSCVCYILSHTLSNNGCMFV